MDKLEELQAAILARADRLAEQYREQAEHARNDILRKTSEKLRLREEREVLLGKSMAERAYRRHVQSNELKLQARMDQLRWNLVKAVHQRLLERLRRFANGDPDYPGVLEALLRVGVQELGRPRVTIQVNAADHEYLLERLPDIQREIDEEIELTLSDEHLDCIGGVVLHTPDLRVRLDNTFEGRLHRLDAALNQVIQEKLMPPSAEEVANVR